MMLAAQNVLLTVNYIKVMMLSFMAIIFGIGFAGFLMPKIIRMVMKMQLNISPGTMTREMFEKVPFPLDSSIYIFNVTNKEEVMAGAKPILQQIGPYYFEVFIDKYDIEDNDEDDTIEYEYRKTTVYHPEKNGPGLTGDEIVNVAHPLVLSMFLAVNVDRPELLPFIQSALNGILNNPKDIFFTGRVWDLLYGGIVIDCSSDGFEVTAICSEFDSGEYKEIRRINETAFKFSLFGNTNGTSVGRFKAIRGKKNILNLGNILTYNGESELDAWYEDECNQISGTDGTIFAPFHEKEDGFTIFIPQMCRSLTLEYQKPSKYAGIKTNHFTLDLDVTRYGEANCYCRDHEICPPKGVLDIFPCAGTPIAISAPHFYNADPAILDKLVGLNPDQAAHEFYLDFYQFAGAPVSALGRAQINFEIVPIEDIEMMKDLQPMYLPALWFAEGVNLGKEFTNLLKYQLILGLRIQKLLKYGCILGGILGLIFGAAAGYMQMDAAENGIRSVSAKSTATLTANPKVQSIEVIGGE